MQRIILFILIWSLSALCFLFVAESYNSSQTLSGEEVSVSFRDVYFLPERLQHNHFATNLGAHFIYALAQQLTPELDLFYGRRAKALYCAIGPALLGAICQSFFGATALQAVFFSLLFALSPGVFCFSGLATEYGLEIPSMALVVLLACKPSFLSRSLAGLLAGFSAILYAPGLVAVAVLGLELFIFPLPGRRVQRWWGFILPMLLCAAVILSPKLFWLNDAEILSGGGNFSSWSEIKFALRRLANEIFYGGESYYYFSKLSIFIDPIIAICAVGFIFTFAWSRCSAVILSGLLFSLLLYLLSGKLPGARRGEPIVFFTILTLACGLISAEKNRVNIRTAANIILTGFVFLGVTKLYSHRAELIHNRVTIPLDFRFPHRPNSAMTKIVDDLIDRGEMNFENFETDRVLTLIATLAPESFPRAKVLHALQEARTREGLERYPFRTCQ